MSFGVNEAWVPAVAPSPTSCMSEFLDLSEPQFSRLHKGRMPEQLQQCPLSTGDTSQDPQWMSEIMDRTEPYTVYTVLSNTYL